MGREVIYHQNLENAQKIDGRMKNINREVTV